MSYHGELRQSTSRTIKLGPTLDKNDGLVAITTPTGTPQLSKNDAAWAGATNSPTQQGIAGYHNLVLTADESDTLGHFQIDWSVPATFFFVKQTWDVITAVQYDMKYGTYPNIPGVIFQTHVNAVPADQMTFVLDNAGSQALLIDNIYQGCPVIISSTAGVIKSLNFVRTWAQATLTLGVGHNALAADVANGDQVQICMPFDARMSVTANELGTVPGQGSSLGDKIEYQRDRDFAPFNQHNNGQFFKKYDNTTWISKRLVSPGTGAEAGQTIVGPHIADAVGPV